MNKPLSILIVDDDSIHNYLCEMLIKKMKINTSISFASNGKTAIDYLTTLQKKNKSCPDLILLDILMPIMDGYEFLEEFKKLDIKGKDRVSIVMISASPKQKEFEVLAKSKVAGFYLKPLTTKSLTKIINQHVLLPGTNIST